MYILTNLNDGFNVGLAFLLKSNLPISSHILFYVCIKMFFFTFRLQARLVGIEYVDNDYHILS